MLYLSSEIANNAVGSSEIANGAVTDAKLASGVGTSAGNLVKLDSAGKLPAIDGSQLTEVVAGAASGCNCYRCCNNILAPAVKASQLASNSVTNAKLTNYN